jgi:hypothetical protein
MLRESDHNEKGDVSLETKKKKKKKKKRRKRRKEENKEKLERNLMFEMISSKISTIRFGRENDIL